MDLPTPPKLLATCLANAAMLKLDKWRDGLSAGDGDWASFYWFSSGARSPGGIFTEHAEVVATVGQLRWVVAVQPLNAVVFVLTEFLLVPMIWAIYLQRWRGNVPVLSTSGYSICYFWAGNGGSLVSL